MIGKKKTVRVLQFFDDQRFKIRLASISLFAVQVKTRSSRNKSTLPTKIHILVCQNEAREKQKTRESYLKEN